MTAMDPYIRILLLSTVPQLAFPSGAYRRGELSEALRGQIEELLQNYGGQGVTDVSALSDAIIEELTENDVMELESDPFAGDYLRYQENRFQGYRGRALNDNPIFTASQRIGARFFPDVFVGYTRRMEGVVSDFPQLSVAPASDRVVSFSDNQVSEIDAATTELIDAVAGQNQIDDSPGLRELLIGQLRAGRELVRAGTFKVYLLEVTLLEGLKFLAKRYEKDAIGGLATALLLALAKHMGLTV